MTEYNFVAIAEDTFPGIKFEIKINDVALDLTNIDIAMSFVKKGSNIIIFTWDSTTQTSPLITKTVPLEGKFQVEPHRIMQEPGLYKYDIQFTTMEGNPLAATSVKTYVRGILNLEKDITKQ